MNITKPFITKTLDNGIKIFIVQDHLLENDLIIKFKNYGAVIDHYFNIIGFQHLLEHCFFFQTDNYNLSTNASTSFSDMNIEISFQNPKVYPNNPTLLVIKKWFFKNNDFTRLDFSRDLTRDEVILYINELDNEFIYRDLLSIHWGLQNFCLSNKDYHYFGGNRSSFYNKENEIIAFLKKPFPVPTEDINIYLRISSYQFYNEIAKIFSKIKKVHRPKITFDYNKTNFFNKVVQINRSDFNELVFILDKNLFTSYDLVKMSLLFNNFSFSENSYINEYYISFNYTSINDLCQVILALEKSPDLFLRYYLTNDPISDNILYYEMFELIPRDVLHYFLQDNITKYEFYEREKKNIDKFISLLKQAVLDKEYIINTKIDNFYKYQTVINEPYNIFDINFNFKNFYNVPLISDNNLWRIASKNKCNRNKEIIKIDLNKGEINNNLFQFINKPPRSILKPSIYFYFESLILYFSMPTFSNLKNVIDWFHKHQHFNILKIQPTNNIVLSDKIYTIQTEYDFIFTCFQISNKHMSIINDSKTNLIHKLKKLGLLYHLETVQIKFIKKSLIFYYTSCRKEGLDIIINYIKASFVSNNIPYSFNIVKSESSFFNNLSSLQKNIIMKY